MRMRVRKHCGASGEEGCELPFESFLPANYRNLREGWFGEEGDKMTITWIEENAFTYRLSSPGYDCGCRAHPEWDLRYETADDWFVEVSDMRQLSKADVMDFLNKMWGLSNMTEVEEQVLARAELAHRLVEGRAGVSTAVWTPQENDFLPTNLRFKYGLAAKTVAHSLVPFGAAIHLGPVRCQPLFPTPPLPPGSDAGAWAPMVVIALNDAPFLCNASTLYQANEPPVDSETAKDNGAGLTDSADSAADPDHLTKSSSSDDDKPYLLDGRRAEVHTLSEKDIIGNFIEVEGGGGRHRSAHRLAPQSPSRHRPSGHREGDAGVAQRQQSLHPSPVHTETNESNFRTSGAAELTSFLEERSASPSQEGAVSPQMYAKCPVTLEIWSTAICGLHGNYQPLPGSFRCQCSEGWKGAYMVDGETPQATRVIQYGCAERDDADGASAPAKSAERANDPCNKSVEEMSDEESVSCRGRHKDNSVVVAPPVDPVIEKQKEESLKRAMDAEAHSLQACASCMGLD